MKFVVLKVKLIKHYPAQERKIEKLQVNNNRKENENIINVITEIKISSGITAIKNMFKHIGKTTMSRLKNIQTNINN